MVSTSTPSMTFIAQLLCRSINRSRGHPDSWNSDARQLPIFPSRSAPTERWQADLEQLFLALKINQPALRRSILLGLGPYASCLVVTPSIAASSRLQMNTAAGALQIDQPEPRAFILLRPHASSKANHPQTRRQAALEELLQLLLCRWINRSRENPHS
jgi:hypothetical protein